MAEPAEPEWVLSSNIPFAQLTDADLEQCVYWLLDAMGAQDLVWRQGSAGRGAADGGRDLEATLYPPGADGELRAERWWIECKGRTGTLERDAVKTAAVNALAMADLDVLVVVTNTTFTNPTRDWIAQFQATHPRPVIRLWDRNTLERLLARQPAVVARLFQQALSSDGRLRAVQERFWNKLEFSPSGQLATLWADRAMVTVDGFSGFALVANEFAAGDITERPWAGAWPAELRVLALHAGLMNTPYLTLRSAKVGVSSEPMVRALAYLTLACLDVVSSESLAALMLEAVRDREADALPDFVVETLLLPVLNQLLGEFQDVCAADCRRFRLQPTILRTEEGDEIADYWLRLQAEGRVRPDPPARRLIIEQTSEPCVVGFACDAEHSCPLFEITPDLTNIAELLAVLDRIVAVRKGQTEPLAR